MKELGGLYISSSMSFCNGVALSEDTKDLSKVKIKTKSIKIAKPDVIHK